MLDLALCYKIINRFSDVFFGSLIAFASHFSRVAIVFNWHSVGTRRAH